MDMNEFAGGCAFVSHDRLNRFQIAPPVQPMALQNAPDRGARDTGFLCDPVHGPALAAQSDDLCLNGCRCPGRTAPGFRRAIPKPRRPLFAIPLLPLVNGPDTHPQRAGHIFRMLSAREPRNQHLSTFRRKPGILMHVHSVLPVELQLMQTSASQRWIE